MIWVKPGVIWEKGQCQSSTHLPAPHSFVEGKRGDFCPGEEAGQPFSFQSEPGIGINMKKTQAQLTHTSGSDSQTFKIVS